MELIGKFIKPFGWVTAKLEEHYDGRLPGISQALFAVGLTAVIFSPIMLYTLLIGLQLQPPYCYIGMAVWLAFIGFTFLLDAYFYYAKVKALVQSHLQSADFKWDIDRLSKEYTDMLKKKRSRPRS